jgi:hypothetical protein
MRTLDRDLNAPRRFDLLPALFTVAILAFVGFAGLDVLRSWPGAEHGLLIYERTCPIYPHHQKA